MSLNPRNTIRDQYDLESAIDIALNSDDLINADGDDDGEESQWYPEIFVVLWQGRRGGGKTTELARWGGWYVENTDCPVYANLGYYTEKFKEAGYSNIPQWLDVDQWIMFNLDQPLGAFNLIDEVDSHLDKLRTVSNQAMLVSKQLEQLRKRWHKYGLACQFGKYLPYGTLDQVDLLIEARDLFFTPAGRDAGIRHGERFLYIAQDLSGLFTGGRTLPIFYTVPHAYRTHKWFDTNFLHDPTAFAKKFKIEHETFIMDSETGEAYSESDRQSRKEEKALKDYRNSASLCWASEFMGWVEDNLIRLNIHDQGNRRRIKESTIQREMGKLKGKQFQMIETSYHRVMQMCRKNGVIERKGGYLEFLRPSVFAQDEDVVEPIPIPAG